MVGDPPLGDADSYPRMERQAQLKVLLDEVVRTRAVQHQEQSQRGSSAFSILPARRAALNALEEYAEALEQFGWPLPPKMRVELHLLRAMCGRRPPP